MNRVFFRDWQIIRFRVVGVPRKLMWISWLIQPGQSLTSRPEQNSARRAVTNCVEPEGWRIVGHNESEGTQLRNRTKLHGTRVYTSPKPASLTKEKARPCNGPSDGRRVLSSGNRASSAVRYTCDGIVFASHGKYGDRRIGSGYSGQLTERVEIEAA